jgi:hypothetical protein
LCDAPILCHDKVRGSLSNRIAKPRDSPIEGTVCDVADDDVRLPTVAPSISVR